MSANAVDREKEITGWIIVGLSAVAAVILYVRDVREAVLGCLVPASYGFSFIWESRKKKEEVVVRPRGIGIGGSLLLYAGLIVCYFVPSLYLSYIRRRKNDGRSVWGHRLLFALYIFPIIPFVFMAVTALVLSMKLFDQ